MNREISNSPEVISKFWDCYPVSLILALKCNNMLLPLYPSPTNYIFKEKGQKQKAKTDSTKKAYLFAHSILVWQREESSKTRKISN